jgi:2-isopropylmalate synthase
VLAPLIYDWNGASPTARVAVHDETLRDGVQAAGVTDPSIDDKRELLHHMVAVGIESANIGAPAAGARAFADAVAIGRAIVDAKLPIAATCAGRTVVADVEAILEVAQQSGLAIEVAMFIGASPIRQHVEGWSLDDMLRATAASVSRATRAGHAVMFVTEDTTRAHPDTLRALYTEAIQCGATRLCVCDTVGHATPAGTRRLLRFICDEIVAPSRTPIALDWHGHRDRGLALANALAAITAGADRVHATALGVGERAGNVEMEILLVNLALLGRTRGDLTQLPAYVAAASRALGVPVPAHHPAVGAAAFSTGTGVHAAAIRKARALGDGALADHVYSGVPASLLGRTQHVLVTAYSGLANVRWWLETHGYDAHNDALAQAILAAAKRAPRPLGDAEIASLAAAHVAPIVLEPAGTVSDGRARAPRENPPPRADRVRQDHEHRHEQAPGDDRVQPVVERQPHGRSRRRDAGRERATREQAVDLASVREEPELGTGRKDLEHPRAPSDDHEPRERDERDQRIARATHLHDDRRPDAERDGREELIGDAEERPQ